MVVGKGRENRNPCSLLVQKEAGTSSNAKGIGGALRRLQDGKVGAAGLLAAFKYNAGPAREAFLNGSLKTLLRSVRIDERDSGHAELGRLLKNQLQTFKLDQGEIQVNTRRKLRLWELFKNPEYNVLLTGGLDLGQIDIAIVRDFVLLSRFDAEYLSEVTRLIPLELSLLISDLVNKKSATRHNVNSLTARSTPTLTEASSPAEWLDGIGQIFGSVIGDQLNCSLCSSTSIALRISPSIYR
jgi:hypothetical protein